MKMSENGDENTMDHVEENNDTEDAFEVENPERCDPKTAATINPIDEDHQFIFDEDSQRLTCVGSSFEEIPQSIIDSYASKTKILDISKNRFRSLASVRHFTELEELILDDNLLDDNQTRFPKLPKLQTLMINKNRFQDIYKLMEQLRQSYPQLSYLSLLGNEACPYQLLPSMQSSSADYETSDFMRHRLEEDYRRYRHLLIFRMPSLRFLDAKEIGSGERRLAMELGSIVYSMGDVKQSSNRKEESKPERNDYYSPLPTIVGEQTSRASLGRIKQTYQGDGSQGNKFVGNDDL